MDTATNSELQTYINNVTPWVVLVMGLVTAIYAIWTHRLNKDIDDVNDKVDDEVEKRETSENRAKAHCEECLREITFMIKDTNREMLQSFREGIKEERQFRVDVMATQGEHIEKIFERLDSFTGIVSELRATFIENMKHQDEMCRVRHREI
jgi:F0F1-type ATP synthase membrane subunit b/b'